MGNKRKTKTFLKACHKEDHKFIQKILSSYTDKNLFEMVFYIGQDGTFPLQFLIKSGKYNEKIESILNITKYKYTNIIPFNDLIPLPIVRQSKLMLYGYYLVNKTREYIKKSWNHPSIKPNYPQEEIIKQREANLEEGRKARDEIFCQIILNDPTQIKNIYQMKENELLVKMSCSLQRKMLNAYIAPALKNGIGNCQECAIVAFLKCKYKAEIMHLDKGDHAVLIIKDHIIVDPWLGVVYLKSQLQDKLKTYIQVTGNNGILYNIITSTKYDTLIPFNLSPSGIYKILDHNSNYTLLKKNYIQKDSIESNVCVEPVILRLRKFLLNGFSCIGNVFVGLAYDLQKSNNSTLQ